MDQGQGGFYEKPPFALNDDERIITSVKPVWMGYFLRRSLGGILGGIFFALLVGSFGITVYGMGGFLAFFFIIWAVIILISVVSAKVSYGKFTVWLTNHRIVSARGLVGFNTESMPLENIVDIVLNRGMIDRILNLSSVMAVPMGGMVMYGRRSNFSTVGFIPALHPDDAVKIQKEIFDLRNARKKELKE